MAYNHKGHYGEYSGNAKHSKRHMVNSWEEEDVSRGRKEMAEDCRKEKAEDCRKEMADYCQKEMAKDCKKEKA